jgi:hypothetical protein
MPAELGGVVSNAGVDLSVLILTKNSLILDRSQAACPSTPCQLGDVCCQPVHHSGFRSNSFSASPNSRLAPGAASAYAQRVSDPDSADLEIRLQSYGRTPPAANSAMISFRLLQSVAFLAALFPAGLLPAVLAQSDTNSRNGGGIIWVAGTVVSETGEPPRIDLGEVHSILPGDQLAVFRFTENHHVPVCSVKIQETSTNWSRPEPPELTPLRKGDRVFAIRILNQFGTPQEFRQAFLERQLVVTTNRNSYSTLRDAEVAMSLHDLSRRQQLWLRELKSNAGRIPSASVSSETWQTLQPLLRQVRRLQDFRAVGVPIERTVGKAWDSVLTTLTPAPAQSSLPSLAEPKQAKQAPAAEQPATSEEPSPAQSELDRRVTLIRQETEQRLFTRFPEERNLVVVLCTAIDIEGPQNELLWISLELAKTQFPQLADDRDMLEEMPVILSRVRQKLNP